MKKIILAALMAASFGANATSAKTEDAFAYLIGYGVACHAHLDNDGNPSTDALGVKWSEAAIAKRDRYSEILSGEEFDRVIKKATEKAIGFIAYTPKAEMAAACTEEELKTFAE